MKLKYFGTAAAEGVPGMFCYCDTCRKSAEKGGRNIRTRSQALVDEKILIDFPPDTYMHILHGGLDLGSITTLLMTHSHSDHLYAPDFEMRRPGFAYTKKGEDEKTLEVYCSEGSSHEIMQAKKDFRLEDHTLHVTLTEPFKPFSAEGYTVIAYKADHAQHLDPRFYSISDGEKTMLYANDTGIFPDETWDYIADSKIYFNYVSLDCTGCIENYERGHMGVESGYRVKLKMIEIGCADENTIFCYHHFSHNGRTTYDELVPIAKEKGFLVSYDGMEIEF